MTKARQNKATVKDLQYYADEQLLAYGLATYEQLQALGAQVPDPTPQPVSE